MSFIGMAGGFDSASGSRFAGTRGRIQNGAGAGVAYPNPFFDIAHTYLPTTVKHLFRWCRYFFLTQPVVNSIAFKLSEYPITDIVFDSENQNVVEKWTDYFQNHLRFRSFQVEMGLDYNVYGNCFVSVGYPFTKYLRCAVCSYASPARKLRPNYVFTNNEFRLTCPRCGNIGTAAVNDYYFRNASGIKLLRWNPEDLEITYNDITGEYTYFYTIPSSVRTDIQLGKKDILEGTPQIFIEAIKQGKGVVFSPENLFHMKRPSLATVDRGWGLPLLLPVLKDIFYLQIMKKSQEAVLLEHLLPLRVLFPQPASGSADPFSSINLSTWKDHVAGEIARWRRDSNYIPILPLPIGQQTIGGDGRGLLMSSEIQQWTEWVITGCGVPIEFLRGGLSWSGTNVSMRMLENAFVGYITRQKAFAQWVMQSIGNFMKWPIPHQRFKPFKMADDLQRKAYRFQLNQAQKLSDTTLLADDDLDQLEENKIMERETAARLSATKTQQLAMAKLQGEQQLIMMKYQAKAQEAAAAAQNAPPAPGEPGGPASVDEGSPGGQMAGSPGGMVTPDGNQAQAPGMPAAAQSPLNESQRLPEGTQGTIDIPAMAYQYAQQLAMMPADQRQAAFQTVSMQSPELADLITQLLRQMGISLQPQQQQVGSAMSGLMQPLPEVLPPRRAGALV